MSQASNRANRQAQQRPPTPWLAVVDAQSVQLVPCLSQHRGLDAHQRINGRKRRPLGDSSGYSWRVVVHAANGHDSRAAQPLLPARHGLRPAWAARPRVVLTDKAFRGQFARQQQVLGWQYQVASRPPSATRGFVPVARRWVIEPTLAWCLAQLLPAAHYRLGAHASYEA